MCWGLKVTDQNQKACVGSSGPDDGNEVVSKCDEHLTRE